MVPAGEGRVHVRPVVGELLAGQPRSFSDEGDAGDALRRGDVVPLRPFVDEVTGHRTTACERVDVDVVEVVGPREHHGGDVGRPFIDGVVDQARTHPVDVGGQARHGRALTGAAVNHQDDLQSADANVP